MILGEPPRTRYDLAFTLARIPVRVHPMFWLAGLLLGLVTGGGPVVIALWILAMFVSLVVHEFGHALAARANGWPAHVVLYGMGGLAIYTPTHQRRGPRIFIAFAGPGAGFLLGAGLLALILASGHGATLPGIGLRLGGPSDLIGGRAGVFLHFLLFMNIFWGLINLAPVLPLDGGTIAGAIIEKYRPRDALALTLKLSIASAVVLGILAMLVWQSAFMAVMFGLLGFESWQILAHARASGRVRS